MTDSYIQQWNLNIQKKVIGNLVMDVGYVGSKGTDLIVTFGDLNRPIAVYPRNPDWHPECPSAEPDVPRP